MATYPFQVRRAIPHFDDFDCIRGWSFEVIGHYNTLGWAGAVRDRNDSDGMDESYAEVIDTRTGRRAFRPSPATLTQECPF